MLLSEIISKPIISLNEAKIKGVISNALFSNFLTKLICFQVISDEEQEDKQLFLDKDCIKQIGDDAVVLKQNYIFKQNCESDIQNPINGLAYSTTGKLLGRILNIELDEKYNVTNVLTKTHTLKIENLISFSNGLYIFNLESKKMKKIINSKFIFPKEIPQIKVSSLPLINEPTQPQTATPLTNWVSNSELLLGKRLTKTIQTLNGEIVGRKGCVVNQKILQSATKNQKLRELAIYSE